MEVVSNAFRKKEQCPAAISKILSDSKVYAEQRAAGGLDWLNRPATTVNPAAITTF
jgi:hypothetical protein